MKLYHSTIVIKAVWQYGTKIDPTGVQQYPEINPDNLSHQILDKSGAKSVSWRKDTPINKRCLENWIYTCRIMKADPSHPIKTLIQNIDKIS